MALLYLSFFEPSGSGSADKLKMFMLMEKIESVENEISPYVSPLVEIVVVEVEKGFANSSGGTEGYDDNNKEIEF